jgi:hypothetical protein
VMDAISKSAGSRRIMEAEYRIGHAHKR